MPAVTNFLPLRCHEHDVKESSGEWDTFTRGSSDSTFHIKSSGQSSGPQASKWVPSGDHAKYATPYEWPSNVFLYRHVNVSWKKECKYTIHWWLVGKWITLTGSTSHIRIVVSLEPVASFRPLGENLQNHTSSQWSFKVWMVSHGNCSLYKEQNISIVLTKAE